VWGVAVLSAAGCSGGDAELPASCRSGQEAVRGALRAAPGRVALADGTRLSTCVERADGDAELQEVGFGYTAAATALAGQAPRSDSAALQLGYLVGATRRGADRSNGVGLELARRVEQAIGIDGPPAERRAAYFRGERAGERAG